MIITGELLRSLSACQDQLKLFEELFPRGLDTTKATLEQVRPFNLKWFAENVLTGDAKTEFLKAETLYRDALEIARKPYAFAKAQALKVARKPYQSSMSEVRKKISEADDALTKEYECQKQPLAGVRAEFESVLKTEFTKAKLPIVEEYNLNITKLENEYQEKTFGWMKNRLDSNLTLTDNPPDNPDPDPTPSNPPSTPTNVVVTPGAVGQNRNTITFTGDSLAQAYLTSFSTSKEGTYTPLPESATTVVVHENLTPGVTYWYKVRAINDDGVSNATEPVFGTIPLPTDPNPEPNAPPTPTGFTAVGGAKRIELSWNASALATAYDLEFATSPTGVFTELDLNPLARTTYSHTGLPDDTMRYYRIRAKNASGTSLYTTTINAKTNVGTTTPPGTLRGIGLLGDSNTNQAGYVSPANQWATLLARATGQTVTNYGVGGAITGDFLTASKVQEWEGGNHAIYVIAFGANDYDPTKSTLANFNRDTLALIARVKAKGAIPVLLTVKNYNYPSHHTFNRNTALVPFVDKYIEIGLAQNTQVINLFAHTKTLNDAWEAGDRTTRLINGVNYPKWQTDLSTSTTNNVHLNDYGSVIVSELLAVYINGILNPDPDPDPPPQGDTARIDFQIDTTTNILNSERGWSENHIYYTHQSLKRIPSGPKIFRYLPVLTAYRTQTIAQSLLDHIRGDADVCRANGAKLVIRFSYTFNEDQSFSNYQDASLSKILSDIDRLSDTLQDILDVIFYMETGFIGRWGEWNKSTNGLGDESNPQNTESQRQVVYALQDALGATRMVALRYIGRKHAIFGSSPITKAEAFRGSRKARVGGSNDYFGKDYGSQSQRDFFKADNLWVPYGGEGVPNSVNNSSGSVEERLRGQNGLNEVRDFRYQNMQSLPGTLSANWRETGVYDDVERGFGARHAFSRSEIPVRATRGAALILTLTMTNTGFGNNINPRFPEIVFQNRSSRATTSVVATFEGGADNETRTDWRYNQPSPTESKSIRFRVNTPSTLAPGIYDLYLRLPDGHANIRGNNRYALQLASNRNSASVYNSSLGANFIGSTTVS